jgi:FtsP/CotA-like multicopper oxidase with cupredoxin domain
MQDIRRGPPPDNGLEVMYASASFNDKMLGHGDPIRVREGQRVLFRLLNASPTENVTLALAGHQLTVIALDGNPVPSPQTIDALFLAPAERADVIVEMNRPGVWILGGIKDEDRKMGLGVVVEYANQRGEPQWVAPPNSAWDYTIFGRERLLPAPDERLDLVFEKIPGGRGGYNRWTINGKSWPAANPLFTTERGKRYRLAMTNKSGDNHPGHLHRHTFELSKVGDKVAPPASTPMRRARVGCCARPPSDHAAAPPSSVTKSRRFIQSPRRRGREVSAAHRGRASWRS